MFVLIVFFFGFGGTVTGQEAVLESSSRAECEAARADLLTVPGYNPAYVKCLPGHRSSVAAQ